MNSKESWKKMKQLTPEWFEARKNKIGSSDAAVLMDVSPWKTPYALWQHKLGLIPDQADNGAMKRGRDLEPIARQEFINLTGIEVEDEVLFHPEYNWMMASLDGLSKDKKVAVEIKCPGRMDHQLALDDIIPEKYIPQLQHQIEVAGLDSIMYFSFNENSCKLIQVDRDQDYIDRLLKKEKAFWYCLQELEAPDLCDRDYVNVENDPDWRIASQAWLEAKRLRKEYEEKEAKFRRHLMDISHSQNVRGCGIRMSKTLRKGSVDYKNVPQLQDVNLDTYRKAPIQVWRIDEE